MKKGQKLYEIYLSGSRLTDEIFDELVTSVMTNGCESVRYKGRYLEYPIGRYFTAKADMRDFYYHFSARNVSIIRKNGNRLIEVQYKDGSNIVAELVERDAVVLG